jgi:hypothetical protein
MQNTYAPSFHGGSGTGGGMLEKKSSSFGIAVNSIGTGDGGGDSDSIGVATTLGPNGNNGPTTGNGRRLSKHPPTPPKGQPAFIRSIDGTGTPYLGPTPPLLPLQLQFSLSSASVTGAAAPSIKADAASVAGSPKGENVGAGVGHELPKPSNRRSGEASAAAVATTMATTTTTSVTAHEEEADKPKANLSSG